MNRVVGRFYQVWGNRHAQGLRRAARLGRVVRRDAVFGGALQIVGTTANRASPANVPVSRRVVLLEQRSHVVVAQVWSDAAGNYAFANVRDGVYYAVGFDHTGQFNGVVATDLRPVAAAVAGGAV